MSAAIPLQCNAVIYYLEALTAAAVVPVAAPWGLHDRIFNNLGISSSWRSRILDIQYALLQHEICMKGIKVRTK
jgi:hypothetical protein